MWVPYLQVGNLLALFVGPDNFERDPGKQKPLRALSCCGLTNDLVMAPVRSQTHGTEGLDISETFWKLKQQLEPGSKTEFSILPKDDWTILSSGGFDAKRLWFVMMSDTMYSILLMQSV